MSRPYPHTLYLAQPRHVDGVLKYGVSSNPAQRRKSLSSHFGPVDIIRTWHRPNTAWQIETVWAYLLHQHRALGDWCREWVACSVEFAEETLFAAMMCVDGGAIGCIPKKYRPASLCQIPWDGSFHFPRKDHSDEAIRLFGLRKDEYGDDLPIEEIAARCGMYPHTLLSRMKEWTGTDSKTEAVLLADDGKWPPKRKLR